MIVEEEALAKVTDSVTALPRVRVPLVEACDRFAASDISALIALPRFDNSAMDGYAVVASACRQGKAQRVIGEQPAGIDRGLRIQSGEAVRLFTGAPIPAGADAVVMQEDVRVEGSEIFVTTTIEPGEFIRRRGCDLAEGQKIVDAGERLRPQMLALLASQGVPEIEVGDNPRVAIISTGDELIPPGKSPEPGQIFESNSILMRVLVDKCGAEVASIIHCPDDRDAIESAFRAALDCDALIVVGGVSVGARDLVKPALNAVGAQTDLWRVAVKPGKPFLFGRAGRCAIFGLPGNPVSAFVTFLLFVRPALLRMMGARDHELRLPRVNATVATDLVNDGDRPHYVRGQLGDGVFTPVGRQESHALFGLSRANALLRVAAGTTVRGGETVAVIPLDQAGI
jgi:molybdopterin molybdotransferase